MARILSSELSAALDQTEHQPVCQVLSTDIVDPIPFDGNSFNTNEVHEWRPYMIQHSNGNQIIAMRDYENNVDASRFVFVYFDTETSIINSIIIDELATSIGSNNIIEAIAIVEQADGNIGIIMARHSSSGTTGTLYRAVVSPTGTYISGPTAITTYPRAASGTYGLTGLSVALFSDGTYYAVYCYTTSSAFVLNKLTSTDWVSWTGPTAISHGLTSSNRTIEGAFVFETAEHDCFLMFGYSDTVIGVELISNIYSMLSTDYGVTWGTATARTAYASAGSSGYGPVLAQKSDGTLFIVYYERSTVLRIDEDNLGWGDSEFGACPGGFNVKTIHYNPSTGHITCSYGRSAGLPGSHPLCGVLVIDVETWSIIDNFNEWSSPPINAVFGNGTVLENSRECAQGTKFIAGIAPSNGRLLIMLLDVEARSIEYIMVSDDEGDTYYSAYGLYPTIVCDKEGYGLGDALYDTLPYYKSITLNEPDADQIYIVASNDYLNKGLWILYIDLDDTSTLHHANTVIDFGGERYEFYQVNTIRVLDNEDRIIIGSGGTLEGGAILLYSKSTIASIQSWLTSTGNGFPYYGCYHCKPTYHNGHIYFNVTYSSATGYDNQRGLCDIDISANIISFIRPSWATADNYYLLGSYYVDEINSHLWIAPVGSVEPGSPDSYVLAARYNLITGEWTTYTSSTTPGMPNTHTDSIGQNITMDQENNSIMVAMGTNLDTPNDRGVAMFNVANDFTNVKYLTAIKGASWEWDDPDDIDRLVISMASMNPAIAVDGSDILWAVWDVYDFTDDSYTPYWDRDTGTIDISDYITDQLKIRWEVKKPNTLEFTLSRGHLYDPSNYNSLLQDIVKKGRRLDIKLGEIYEGISYYENQGSFVVTKTQLSYGRSEYPLVKVHAESVTNIWKEQNIITTALITTTPEALISDIFRNQAQLEIDDYVIPSFDTSHQIEHQVMDTSVWDAIEEIADHLFYNLYDDPDGVITFKKVDVDRAVDHLYGGSDKVTEWSPDDSYSDFTNRVRVVGETIEFVDVTYEEELIETLVGTIGWWENKKERTVLYGKDGSTNRKCRDVRLNIVQSISFQGPLIDALTGDEGSESITEVDPFETYCVVTIDVPNLTTAVFTSVTATLAIAAAGIACEYDCGIVNFAIAGSMALTLYFLMAMANYQYEVWGKPLGEEKQTIEYVANDYNHQRNLGGRIVQTTIDDSFCNDVIECARVANGNLAIVQAQRNRIKFTKVAHMQDELLDKISITHPYSGETVELLIVGLTRTYKKGKSDSSGVFDDIEGWRIL